MNRLKLSYYTNRWKAQTTLSFTKTDDGWDIQHVAHSGPCDKYGSPHLKGNFDQDNVAYPKGIDGYIGHIWQRLHRNEIDLPWAQIMFDELGEWLSTCETSAPKWREYNC